MEDARYDALLDALRELGGALVAYSGGVDSTLLARAAHDALGNATLAVTVESEFLPASEAEDAVRLARAIGIRHRVVTVRALDIPGVEANPPERCYLCKRSIFERLGSLGKLEPCPSMTGNGPAKYFRFPHASGTIGFISPISHHFCFNCNRIRLTAEGKLRPCLLSDQEIDLRQPLRDGLSPEKLKQAITQAIQAKPRQHHLAQVSTPQKRHMSQVGG